MFVLIDDDKIATLINRKILERFSFEKEIRCFNSAFEAIDFFHSVTTSEASNERTFDILLDINMPGMNGWEFISELNNEFEELNSRIHILSSSVDPVDKEKALEKFKVDSYIVKPLNEEVVKRIFLPEE